MNIIIIQFFIMEQKTENNDELLKQIKNKIENLDKQNHIEIFKIFKDNNIPYSENNNGIFINLTETDNNIIEKLNDYLLYIKNQEKDLNILEKEKQKYKENFFD
jgi:hypothetical protein